MKIIPQPLGCKITDEKKTFIFVNKSFVMDAKDLNVPIGMLTSYLAQAFEIKLERGNIAPCVTFYCVPTIAKEGYELSVNDTVTIKYSTVAGVLYAVDTLKQLVFEYNNAIPYCEISDAPKFEHRSFMLDSGRYFFEPKDIYTFIDLMVMHRINVFHWHLSEDQGWRVEITAFPELCKKGSRRSHTNFGIKPHGGYYKKEEIRDIVQYCHDRNIIVIPEFDMPGHVQSVLACYPYLGCFDRKLPVATHWGVKHDIFCAGKETTYSFVKKVLDEMCELFPDKYFHLGGDEAVKTRWELCPNCQNKIKEFGLANENQLQAYFLNNIAEYLQSKGKTVIIWNESEYSNICNSEIIWMMWNASQEGYDRLSADNRKFICADSVPYYLDLTYYQNSLKTVYAYEPTAQIKDKSLFVGLEACLWTEFVPNMKKAMKMAIPRLTAISERAWSEEKDYDRFEAKLVNFYGYLNSNGFSNMKKLRLVNDKFAGAIEKVWFGRRILYWAGLHNEIDNAIVRAKYTKKVYKK